MADKYFYAAKDGVVVETLKLANNQWSVTVNYTDGSSQTFVPLDKVFVFNCNNVSTGDPIGMQYDNASCQLCEVGLTMPSEFSVGNSPLTANGNIGVTWSSQPQHFVFAAPLASDGIPSFRQLSYNDLTDLPVVLDTNTIDLTQSGGTLKADVLLSSQFNNSIVALPDGLWSANTIKAGVVYGGIVSWVSGYSFEITAAGYYINGIFHTSPFTSVTLNPPDGTFNRIDTFIVNDQGQVVVLEGTPSLDPAQAPINPATQLELSFALVETGTTEPTIGTECIYKNNAEWTCAFNSATINPNSTNSPFDGAKDIEGTLVHVNDNIIFTRSSSFNPSTTYNLITLKIKLKAGWANNGSGASTLYLQFLNGTTAVGTSVIIRDTQYGLDGTNTTTYQTVSIPIAAFSFLPSSVVNNLRIKYVSLSTATQGFFIDNICLQDISVPPAPSTISLTTDGTSGAATLIGNVLNVPNYTYTPSVNNRYIIPATTWNFAIGNYGEITLTADRLNLTVTGSSDLDVGILYVFQDSTGGWSLTVNGISPMNYEIYPTPNSVTVLEWNNYNGVIFWRMKAQYFSSSMGIGSMSIGSTFIVG